MKNMMKEYLGNEYSGNHLRNFCLYWIKALESRDSYPSDDAWRKENDLDCLYLDGNLRADTLMSAWTPVKWVADCLNRDVGITFYKTSRTGKDPHHDLKLLAEDGDRYLPPDHALVRLLNRFLELAELRCNFILLPSREMNPARYQSQIRGRKVWLCDEVPATLAHLFDQDSLGKFFLNENGAVSDDLVADWIVREHLEMGFVHGLIHRELVRPLVPGQDPYEPIWPEKEGDIQDALTYMVDFLQARMQVFEDMEKYRSDRADDGRAFVDKHRAYYVESTARGSDRVGGSIEDAFRRLIRDEQTENIGMFDFHIKGDLSSGEVAGIAGCIGRLCRWYGGDHEIPYSFKYENDEKMCATCTASAALYLKNTNGTRPVEVELSMKNEDLPRPDGMTSDVLWEIYERIHHMDRPYMWVNMDGGCRSRYGLYLIKDISFGHGETNYGVGNMGIELPWSREEWIDVELIGAYSKTATISRRRILTDALQSNWTVEEVLNRNHMMFAEGFC